jgi:hypothetical protein
MRTEKTLPSPFRAGAIPDIMMHCLHHKIQVVILSHTSENFLPMEKGEGLVMVLGKQFEKAKRRERKRQ